MQEKDFRGRVRLVPNVWFWLTDAREEFPGFFGLDGKVYYYSSKKVEAIGLDIYDCKCNALFPRVFTLHDQST